MENNLNEENINIPTEEERQAIISQYEQKIKNMKYNREEILSLSKCICKIYYSHKDFIFPDILQIILTEADRKKKLEYLYLMIEIIKYFDFNKNVYEVTKIFFSNLFLCVQKICRLFYYSFNKDFTKNIKNSLIELKKYNIYPSNNIDELLMELRLTTEPNITDSIDDRKILSRLVNKNILKIDFEMINLHKDIEDLKRNNNNNNIRVKLIKNENNMIEKQIKLYNENLKQVKCLNDLIELCNTFCNN